MAYIGNGHRRPAEVASTPEATAAQAAASTAVDGGRAVRLR